MLGFEIISTALTGVHQCPPEEMMTGFEIISIEIISIELISTTLRA
jgi:hypothetical protein